MVVAACEGGSDSAGFGVDAGAGSVNEPPVQRFADASALDFAEGARDTGLSIEPATAVLVITERGARSVGQFRAHRGAGTEPLDNVKWSLSNDLVEVDERGTVTTRGLTAGEVELTASDGEERTTAKIYISVALRDVSADLNPDNLRALEGFAKPDPGLTLVPPNPTVVLQPEDQMLVPPGMNAPIVLLSPGSIPPEDVRVYISAEGFGWDGFLHVDTPLMPRLAIPRDVWDGAMASARGGTVAFEITKASSGAAYGPATAQVIAADPARDGAAL